ncbi:MAG: DUF4278 domain-containing protein [Leptolyngbyaceae cyanobacterium SM2_5_2]|nr:DUF4278 domain-containing protein [Leptolyngbyaceae cyanobacterium SM2_5_2]
MQLTYRGVSYDYQPNPMPIMGPTIDTGHYRGAAVTFQAIAELPDQPAADLTWRGVAYQTGTVGVAPVTEQPAITAPAAGISVSETAPLSISERARSLFIRRHQRSRKREQGMMVRLAAEVGLPIEEAAHYESHIQGKLPHDFRPTIAALWA